jgi:hypothetical protein
MVCQAQASTREFSASSVMRILINQGSDEYLTNQSGFAAFHKLPTRNIFKLFFTQALEIIDSLQIFLHYYYIQNNKF